MRYLTIQRNKSFVACLMRLKVYVEDPNAGEIKIQGVPCRKIGELKNGEQQSFMIGDEKLRIFVIGDKLSKNYCFDFYEVPEGTDNVFISGACKYNPLNGNAFRFDGIPTEEMKYRRRKANRRGILINLTAWIIGIAIGLGLVILPLFATPEEKVFTKGNVSITLNEDFKEEFNNSFDAVYNSGEIAVFVLEEKFDDDEAFEAMTLDEYCNAVIEANGKNTEPKHKDGLTYYEYDWVSDQNYKFRYLAFVFKADDGFYLVQFGVQENMYSVYEDDIFAYAKSVTFKQNAYI